MKYTPEQWIWTIVWIVLGTITAILCCFTWPIIALWKRRKKVLKFLWKHIGLFLALALLAVSVALHISANSGFGNASAEVSKPLTWMERLEKLPCPHAVDVVRVKADLVLKIELCYEGGMEKFSLYLNGELAEVEFWENDKLVKEFVYDEVYRKHLPVKPVEKTSYEQNMFRTDI